MTVQIIENFISRDVAILVREVAGSSLIESKERPGFYESSGKAPKDVSDLVDLAKVKIENYHKTLLTKQDYGLVRLTTGTYNGLHSDMYNLDGSQHDDGSNREDELEFSAIMYLSEYGTDFTGGELVFPQHDIWLKPKAGDLVFFRGDLDHKHRVRHILSGERYAIVMFFGK